MNLAITDLRWMGLIAVFGLGGIIAVGNWGCLIGSMVTKKNMSFVPLIGGILIAVGISALPLEGAGRWAWLGLLVDFGSLPLAFLMAHSIWSDRRRGGTRNSSDDPE